VSLLSELAEHKIDGSVVYVTVDDVLYRLETVSTLALLRAGTAYVEGVTAIRAEMDTADEATEAAIRQGAAEGDADRLVAEWRARKQQRALEAHRRVVSTTEGAQAYLERVSAYTVAAVSGMGRPPEVAERVDPDVPGVIYHGSEQPAEVDEVVLVDVPRPSRGAADALRQHAAAGEWPLWHVPVDVRGVLAGFAAQLAGGRAEMATPFRACS